MAKVQGRGELTQRQRDVLHFFKGFLTDHAGPPTMREMADHFGCQVNAITGHVSRLVELGYLTRDGRGKARCLRVVGEKKPEDARIEALEAENARLRAELSAAQAAFGPQTLLDPDEELLRDHKGEP